MSIYSEDWGDPVDTPRYITRDEQQQEGLVQATRYVPAVSGQGSITQAEQSFLSQSAAAAGQLIAHRQMSHLARSDDTAITHAVGSLVYSIPYLLVVAAITGALCMLAFFMFEGEEMIYLVLWLGLWGVCALHYLTKNRELGLKHSAAGIELEDIQSREEIAKYIIDKHVEVLKEKWKHQS